MKLTFEDVIGYAEWMGYNHRGEVSKATDWTQSYLQNPWNGAVIMVLYEGEKRIVGNHDAPEVCWICIDINGRLYSTPSRYLRRMTKLRGFGFTDIGREALSQYFAAVRAEHQEDI